MSAPRALVLGAAGQDGSYLVELLVGEGYEVFGVVRSLSADTTNLSAVRDRIELLHGDLAQPEAVASVMDRARPDEVYHLAAPSFVPVTWEEPEPVVRVVPLATATLLGRLARMNDPPRLVYASTSEVFDPARESPQSECSPYGPSNPYGAAKLHGQTLVAAYRERHGVHASSAILFNHESPRRPPDFLSRKVTHAAAAISLGLQDELALGDLEATRDWGFAGDYVEAMWRMSQQPEPGDYVIATGVGRTVRQLVETAFEAAGVDPDRHVIVDQSFVRPPEPGLRIGDPALAAQRLGWRPATSFEEMIAAMVHADLARLRSSAQTGPLEP